MKDIVIIIIINIIDIIDYYGYYGHTPHQEYPYRDVLRQQFARWEISQEISDQIRSECLQCRENFVIFDSSSFGKILVSGARAVEGLEWLCTNNMRDRFIMSVSSEL